MALAELAWSSYSTPQAAYHAEVYVDVAVSEEKELRGLPCRAKSEASNVPMGGQHQPYFGICRILAG